MPVRIHSSKLVPPETLKPALTRKTRRRREALKEESRLETIAPPPRNDLRPSLKVIERQIDELKLPRRQARKLGPDDIKEVANSIQHFGICDPIIIGKNNRVIDGAAVIEAARSLGLCSVPCVELEHLNEVEERALRLALNRIGQDREYDLPELKLELEELKFEEQPIRILGFSDAQLDMVLSDETPASESTEDVLGTMTEEPVSRSGDLWCLGNHRLLCGDAKAEDSYARLMGGDKAQLALTDPPYAVAVGKVVSTKHRDFVEGGGDMDQDAFEALIASAFRHMQGALIDGGLLLSFMDFRHVSDLIRIGKALKFELINIITWVKHQGGMGSLWRSQSEFVVALKKAGKHKNNVELGKHGRDRTNVWEYAGAGTIGSDARKMLKDHPTPKPVPMLIDAIYDVTDIGDIVLDPFGGSGSTLMACEETDRHARVMELDPLYCDLIIRRWESQTGQSAILSQSDQEFSDVTAQRQGFVDIIDEQ